MKLYLLYVKKPDLVHYILFDKLKGKMLEEYHEYLNFYEQLFQIR